MPANSKRALRARPAHNKCLKIHWQKVSKINTDKIDQVLADSLYRVLKFTRMDF